MTHITALTNGKIVHVIVMFHTINKVLNIPVFLVHALQTLH